MECVLGSYLEDDFLRIIEVSSDMRLSELHILIQKLIGFSDAQVEDCFMATRLRGKKIHFIASRSHPNPKSSLEFNQTLAEIFPTGTRKKLFYSFNFGDNWIFEIKKTSGVMQSNASVDYPRIIHEEGTRPI